MSQIQPAQSFVIKFSLYALFAMCCDICLRDIAQAWILPTVVDRLWVRPEVIYQKNFALVSVCIEIYT